MTFGPESAPRDAADTRRWQRWVEDELKLLRSSRGVLERGSVAGGVVTVREILRDPTKPIQFLNTDTATCPRDGADIHIVLTHVPKAGSEQVFYNGTPLQRGDWTRTDTVLTIPGETWFRSGKVAWVDYAYNYYDEGPAKVLPSLIGYTLINGNHSSIAVPAGTNFGDRLVLVLAARDSVGCSDPRFDAGYHDSQRGVWAGISDGSGIPVAITLDSTASDGGVDCVGVLAAFTGSPMDLTADAGSSGVAAPFTPTDPAGGGFGIAGIAMSSGLLSGLVTDETTSTWTTVVRAGGFGAGKMSVYLGYDASGTPTGTWNTTGGIARWVARIVGVQ